MERENLIITCKCGCGNSLNCRILDGAIYISTLSGDFYIRQGLFNNLKERFRMFFGKRLLKDIIVDKEQLLELRQFLLSASYENDEITNNDSFLYIDCDEDYGELGIWLVSNLNDKDILLGKIHRPYELMLNKKERNILVKRIDKAIKLHNERTLQ